MFKFSLQFFNLVSCKILPKYSIQWPNFKPFQCVSSVHISIFLVLNKIPFSSCIFSSHCSYTVYELFRFSFLVPFARCARCISKLVVKLFVNSLAYFVPLQWIRPFLLFHSSHIWRGKKMFIIQCKFCLSISYNAMHRCSTWYGKSDEMWWGIFRQTHTHSHTQPPIYCINEMSDSTLS